MSRSGEIALEFGGEERTFRLGIGQWRKVQEACDAGPAELLARLSPAFTAAQQGIKFDQIVALGFLGNWRLDDVREPILQGLLGANMAAPDALKLVKTWVDERPLIESVGIAYRIVLGSVIGTEDEDAAGESEAVEEGSPLSPAASSDLGTTDSMPWEPLAASPPETSMR
jgi:hypothetical protein